MLFVLAIGWKRLVHLLRTSKPERLQEAAWMLAQIERQVNAWDAYEA